MEREFKKVLITGIGGSGGSYMAEHILGHNPRVRVYGTSRPVGQAKEKDRNLALICDKTTVYYCDFSSIHVWKATLKNILPDAIFHFASNADVRESHDRKIWIFKNNIDWCGFNFFDGILDIKNEWPFWDPVIMHCSTSEVYGKVLIEDTPIKETKIMQASSPYGISKIAQDMMAEEYFTKFGLKIIRARMFTYVSPRRKNIFATAFAMQVARIEAGLQKELVHGNLDSVRTILDVRDGMEAYWVAAQKCKFGEAYNIGGKKIISVGEFLELLKSKAKCKITSRIDPALLRPSDVTLQIPDTSKFEQETGWFPKYSFSQTVDHLLEHCRNQIKKEI